MPIFQGLVPTIREPQPPRRRPVIRERPRGAPTASPPPQMSPSHPPPSLFHNSHGPAPQNRPPRFYSRSSPTLTDQGPRDGVGPSGDHADSSLSSASPSSSNKSQELGRPVANRKSVTCLSWNIDGLVGKLSDSDFMRYIQNFDIICLIETFIDATFDLSN